MSGWQDGGRESGWEQGGELDRLLNGLRVGEVPAGLEQRVLRGVQARVARGELARNGRWGAWFGRGGMLRAWDWSRRGWRVAGYVTATVAVAILLMVGLVRDRSRIVLPERAGVRGGKALGHGAGRLGRRDSADAVVAGRADSGARVEKQVDARDGVMRGAASRAARDAGVVAASERIGGMPAPPLPLTEQERLLLEVVRARNVAANASVRAASLEMLNQKQQDEELARNDAEFLKFFPPPPPPPDDPDGAAAKYTEADGDGAGQEVMWGIGKTKGAEGKR